MSVLSASRQRPIVCLSIRRHCNAARVGSDRRASLIKCAASCRPFRRIDNDTAKAVARPRQPRQSGVRGTRKLGTSVEDSRQKRQRKKGRLKKGQLKNGNGRNGKRKVWQLEKSATKSERVGKQGNKKLMCVITATEKRATENKATEEMATGKLGNRKIRQRKLTW